MGVAFDAEFLLAKTEDVSQEVQFEEDNYVAGLEWGEEKGADVSPRHSDIWIGMNIQIWTGILRSQQLPLTLQQVLVWYVLQQQVIREAVAGITLLRLQMRTLLYQ